MEIKNTLINILYDAIATLGYVGFFPWAPGTVASLVTVVLVWIGQAFLGVSTAALLIVFSILLFVGWYVSGIVAARYQEKDPSFIVIDEVVAMGLIAVMVGSDPMALTLGFGFFRFFDIVKPFPIYVFDQKCSGGFGIMVDDLVAAIMTLLVYKGIFFVMPL